MLNKKILILLISMISFSNLKTHVDINEINQLKQDIAYKKIENPNIYKSYLVVKNDIISVYDNIEIVTPLASLTKLITAMVVLDNVNSLDEIVKISKNAQAVPYGIRVKASETYTIRQLLEMMLVNSSNSSAKALADYVSDEFVTLMNNKVKSLGLTSMKFYTPHGLPTSDTNLPMDVGNATDIYKLSRYIIENYPVIKEIVAKDHIIVKNKVYENTNPVIKLDGVKGMKTGYHRMAGYNIVIFYEDENNKMYQVILGADTINNRKSLSELAVKNMEF